jgi:fructokinase
MFRVVGIGEVLWDLLPDGPQLGGAPANFAVHAHALGAQSSIVSRVGDDALGREIVSRLTALSVPIEGLQVDPAHPTGIVTVTLDPEGQPQFDIARDAAWDHIALTDAATRLVSTADAVCFGTLAQRSTVSRRTIQQLVQCAPARALRVFDINFRQAYYSRARVEESLALASVLKVNDAELPELARMFALGGNMRSQLAELAGRWQLRAIVCTRGASGSLLCAGGECSEHPGIPTDVVDTVGAGDSFTAAMALGLLAGWTLDQISDRANRVAAFVASNAGATPAPPTALRALFDT